MTTRFAKLLEMLLQRKFAAGTSVNEADSKQRKGDIAEFIWYAIAMTVQVTQAICCHPCHAMFRLCRHFSAGTGSSDHGPNDEYPSRTVPAQNFSQIRDANRTG